MEIKLPPNPLSLFSQWFGEASTSEPNDPNAMSIATVDKQSQPSVRMVLLKSFDAQGFCFYTNLHSRKAQDLQQQPKTCLNFYWKSLQRQVRIYGTAHLVTEEEADRYFATRSTGAQIGAWASHQSDYLESREALEKEVVNYALKFGDKPIPRPSYWSGFRICPFYYEFWQQRPFRLHDRFVYEHQPSGVWKLSRLSR